MGQSRESASTSGASRVGARFELTRIGGILLGLGLIIGAANNESVKLSNQILPELPAPGLLAVRVLVAAVGILLLLWGLDHLLDNQISRAVATLKTFVVPSIANPSVGLEDLKRFMTESHQLEAKRDTAIRHVREIDGGPDAELQVKADFLVQAIRALESGYRRVFGLLLRFDKSWNADYRREVISILEHWLDQRIIIPVIDRWRYEIAAAAPDNQAAKALVAAASEFFAQAVNPLLGLKHLYKTRLRLTNALQQGNDFEFVRNWAQKVLGQLDKGNPAMQTADEALGTLRAAVPPNRL